VRADGASDSVPRAAFESARGSGFLLPEIAQATAKQAFSTNNAESVENAVTSQRTVAPAAGNQAAP
jgi:hypothetical protein